MLMALTFATRLRRTLTYPVSEPRTVAGLNTGLFHDRWLPWRALASPTWLTRFRGIYSAMRGRNDVEAACGRT